LGGSAAEEGVNGRRRWLRAPAVGGTDSLQPAADAALAGARPPGGEGGDAPTRWCPGPIASVRRLIAGT
jgi:hypothetical protein